MIRVIFSTFIAVTLDTLCLLPIILQSSPSTRIVLIKLASLIIFKLVFVMLGLFFTVRLKDFIKIEEERESARIKLEVCHQPTNNTDKIELTNIESIFKKKYVG